MTRHLRFSVVAGHRRRVYTISVEARDAAGNTAIKSLEVRVPLFPE